MERPPLAEKDFLWLLEAAGLNYARAARVTGFSEKVLLRRAGRVKMRGKVSEIRKRLQVSGGLWSSPKNRTTPVTEIEIARGIGFGSRGQGEGDTNPSVPLTRIVRLVQMIHVTSLENLIDHANLSNLGNTYEEIAQHAGGLLNVVQAISQEAGEGISRSAGGDDEESGVDDGV